MHGAMNYERQELLEELAAQYVIGTLQGQARARFEQLRRESVSAQQAVWRWENRLNPLATRLTDIDPPRHVWNNIQRTISSTRNSASKRLGWWSAISTATVVLLSVLLFTTPDSGPSHIAQFSNDQAQPMWIVGANLDDGTLNVRAINAQAASIDKAFELWMLPDQGPPQSLGLLPVNNEKRLKQLPPGLNALLQSAPGLAISIEPAGGSPTGLPTGQVVYTTQLVKL